MPRQCTIEDANNEIDRLEQRIIELQDEMIHLLRMAAFPEYQVRGTVNEDITSRLWGQGDYGGK